MSKIAKIIYQCIIIVIFLKVGDGLSLLLRPLIFIPGSLLGMLIMFSSLLSGLFKIEWIEEVSNFFLKHMGFFFIPLGVSLLKSRDMLKNTWIQLGILLIISCCLVMVVSSKVTEVLIKVVDKKRVEDKRKGLE